MILLLFLTEFPPFLSHCHLPFVRYWDLEVTRCLSLVPEHCVSGGLPSLTVELTDPCFSCNPPATKTIY